MSLITDPWDDEEVDDGQLETQFKQIRICSHRSHSSWTDDVIAQTRSMGGPLEIKPAMRIMQRNQPTKSQVKKPDNSMERIDKTLEERERAYAEARRRILGDDDEKEDSKPTKAPERHERSERGSRRGKYRNYGGRGGSARESRAPRETRENGSRNESRNTERRENEFRDRPRGPTHNHRGGFKTRSNGYRGRGGGYRMNQDHDRT